eukprot:9466633-Pyramimonas_sp.AAC.1
MTASFTTESQLFRSPARVTVLGCSPIGFVLRPARLKRQGYTQRQHNRRSAHQNSTTPNAA